MQWIKKKRVSGTLECQRPLMEPVQGWNAFGRKGIPNGGNEFWFLKRNEKVIIVRWTYSNEGLGVLTLIISFISRPPPALSKPRKDIIPGVEHNGQEFTLKSF